MRRVPGIVERYCPSSPHHEIIHQSIQPVEIPPVRNGNFPTVDSSAELGRLPQLHSHTL